MKLLYTLASLSLFGIASAQNKKECPQFFSDFQSYYKTIEFSDLARIDPNDQEKVIEKWISIQKNCPSFDEKIYILGEEMFLKILKPLNIGDEKQSIARDLVTLYDAYDKFYSKNNNLKKIIISHQNQLLDDKQTKTALEEQFKKDPKMFNTLAFDLYVSLLLQDSVNSGTITSEILNHLDNITLEINKLKLLKNEEFKALQLIDTPSKEQLTARTNIKNEINTLELISKNIDSYINSKINTCEQWIAIYESDFEKNSKNADWLEKATNKLYDKKCSFKSNFFTKVATAFFENKKNSTSAYIMALIYSKNKKTDEAIKHFEMAADLASDTNEKATIYYSAANTAKASNKALAEKLLNKSLKANPNYGEAYILLSQIYGSSANDCKSNSDFNKKAIYWLAAQTAQKAAQVDSSLKYSAEKLAEGFMSKAPSKEEIKTLKMEGKTINFDCWIKETIVVPNLN